MKTLKTLLILLLCFPSLGFSFGITWEGRLLDGGSPDNNVSRSILVELYGPSGSCLIFSETHAGIDTTVATGSDGFVSLVVGTGSGQTGVFDETVFDNTITPGCLSGIFTPINTYDDRKLKITVDGQALTPMVAISLTPAAAWAKQATIAQSLDVDAVVTASITDGVITNTKLSGIGADCAAGDTVGTDGSGNFVCDTNLATNTTTIASNTAGIATNTTSITANTTSITANTTALAAKLDTTGGTISGALTIANGSQGAGKVLTSDAAGLATWTAVPGDDLGNHTATANLVMGSFDITGVTNINGTAATELATVSTNTGNITSNAAAITANLPKAGGTMTGTLAVNGAGAYLDYRPNGAACSDGQVLKWANASNRWECAADAGAGGGDASSFMGEALDPALATGTTTDGQTLVWSQTNSRWEVATSSSLDLIAGGTVTGATTFSNTVNFGGTFNLTGGTANYVLTSDGVGNGTWQAAPAYTGSSGITLTGSDFAITPTGINNSHLAADSVTSAKITDGSIAIVDVAPGSFLELVSGGSVSGATTFTSALTTGDINSSNTINATNKVTSGAFWSNSYCDNAGANCFDPSAGAMGDFKADGSMPMTANLQLGSFNIMNTGQIQGHNGTVAAPTYAFTLDVNSGMYSFANDHLSFVTAGTDRLAIDPSGFVGIGTSTPAQKLHVMDGPLLIEDTTAGTTAMAVLIEKSRAGAVVQDGDELGAIEFKGMDSNPTMSSAAYMQAEVDGNPNTSGVPGRLVFKTRDVAGFMNQRMVIGAEGDFTIGASLPDPNGLTMCSYGSAFDPGVCECNDGYTFEDTANFGIIDNGECIEPGIRNLAGDGVQVLGNLFVGDENDYRANPGGAACSYDGLGCKCNDGFIFADSDSDNLVEPSIGECLRYGIDVGKHHVSVGTDFAVGNFGDPVGPIAGYGCTEGSTDCFCSPGHTFNNKDGDANVIDIGECEGSMFATSQKHGGTVFGAFEVAQMNGADGCTPYTPGTCDCEPGAYWDDINNDDNLDGSQGECKKGAITVGGVMSIGSDHPIDNSKFSVKGDVYIEGELQRERFSNNAPDGNITYYSRAQGTPDSPAGVVAGDIISEQRFEGHDGGSFFQDAAAISVVVDPGAISASVPARIEFATGDGAGSMGIAMTIQSDKTVHIKTVMKLEPQAGAPFTCDGGPSGPKDGVLAYNQTGGRLCLCDGSAWIGVSGAGCTGW